MTYTLLKEIIYRSNNERINEMKICIFGASSEQIDKIYISTAESLGRAAVLRGDSVIFGAGKYGVMGAVARGAAEAKGELIGIAPRFFINDRVLFDGCTELVFTETMRERKAEMEDRADAFIICAGGIGTFEEFFEVLTLRQLSRHTKPIIIYNVAGYYDALLAMMEKSVSEGFMSEECLKLFTVAHTEQEVFEQIDNYQAYTYNKYGYLKDGESNG